MTLHSLPDATPKVVGVSRIRILELSSMVQENQALQCTMEQGGWLDISVVLSFGLRI